MNINGQNGLACITSVSSVVKPGEELVLRPLPGLPVVECPVPEWWSDYMMEESQDGSGGGK